MADPCRNEDWLKELDNKVDSLGKVLITLAEQKAEISHLIKAVEDLRDWMRGHETRLQSLERQPGQGALKILWMVASAIAGAIVMALLK